MGGPLKQDMPASSEISLKLVVCLRDGGNRVEGGDRMEGWMRCSTSMKKKYSEIACLGVRLGLVFYDYFSIRVFFSW